MKSEFRGERLVTVATFRDLPEALLAKGRLESAGIECILGDDNLVRMDWFWANALGGVKLRVFAGDAEQAREMLALPIPARIPPEELGEEYLQPFCPRCHSMEVRYGSPNRGLQLSILAFLPLPLPAKKKRWMCDRCGASWKDGEPN